MYILEKNNQYVSNIIVVFNNSKAKCILSDNVNFAVKFYDKKDAKAQAKRFKCNLKEL